MLPDFHNAVPETKCPKENLVYWYYDFSKLWGVRTVFHTQSLTSHVISQLSLVILLIFQVNYGLEIKEEPPQTLHLL